MSLADLPIYEKWTDEYMMKKFSHEFVEVEEGKKVSESADGTKNAHNLFFGSALIAGVFLGWQENRDLSMWTDTFKGFLTKYQGKDPTDKFRGNFYSVSAVPALSLIHI